MNHTRLFIRAALASGALLAGISTAQAQTEADEIRALREQIAALDQKLRVLERKQELKEEEAAAAAKKQPVVSAGASGFGITAGDKSYDLKLRGLVQVDGRLFFDDGAPNRDSILLRRIRTSFTGTVASIYDFNITPEFGTGTNNTTSVSLWDAFFAARFSPEFGLKFGKFAPGVTLEPGNNRHFNESPFPNQLQTNRDLGLEAFGAFGALDYRLGAFLGVANNTTNFGGASADLLDGDRTLSGRVSLSPFKGREGTLSKLSLGLGASHGNEIGTAGSNISNGLANISSNAQQQIFSYGAVLRANGTHLRVSPAFEWYTGTPFSVVGEYTWESQDISVNPAGLTRSFDNEAWRLSAAWVLTGEESGKSGVTPKSNFNYANGAWGAFELVARLSALDLDEDLFVPVTDGGAGLNRNNNVESAFAVGLGLNWYLNRNVRFLINVENTTYEGGKTPTAAVGARDDELALLTRAHLSF
ncbi:MAG: porin [Opitutaceae bacterium]|nr:porin [Opitutaceae bacterium]